MDSNETGHNLKCENHRNEFLVLNKFSNLRNASGDTVCMRARMHNMLVSSGNDYMYHLRLKSQRCRCAQVHHYYLAINLSVHSFAIHSFACIESREMRLNVCRCCSVTSNEANFLIPRKCNVQSGLGVPSDGLEIRGNLKHFIYGIFVCEFTRYFWENDALTPRKTITINAQTQHAPSTDYPLAINLFTFVRN